MKAFFQEYGPDMALITFIGLVLGGFFYSSYVVRRGPAGLPESMATEAPKKTPQLSGFAKLPPKARTRKAKRKAEPRYEAPRQDEVRAMPMDQGWLK